MATMSMLRAGRAIATNQLAGAFPRLYMRLARQNAPGGGEGSPYREIAKKAGFANLLFETGLTLALTEVEAFREKLWEGFRLLPPEELACLTFWLCLEKRSAK